MRSTLDKALVALLNEDADTAEQLFHEFVLQRAREINESIVETGDIDVDAVVEGKTYKRDEEETVDAKKKTDKQRKEASKQKRKVEESFDDITQDAPADAQTVIQEPLADFKASIKGFDDEALTHMLKSLELLLDNDDGEELDSDAKSHISALIGECKRRGIDVSAYTTLAEGKLELVQGDDGTLVVTHTPDASAEVAAPVASVEPEFAVAAEDDVLPAHVAALAKSAEANVVEPGAVDISVSPETDMDFDLDLGMDDDEFKRLGESLVDELEKVCAIEQEGHYATGKLKDQELHSPVPNVAAEKRVEKAKAATIKGTEHKGFDLEQAPAVKGTDKARNTMARSTDSSKKVSKEGNGKALLNKIGDDKAAKSPVGGK